MVDADFDRIWLALRDVSYKGDRAVRVPAGETAVTLPASADRANRFLSFNASGNPIAAAGAAGVPVSPFMEPVLSAANAAAAQALLDLDDILIALFVTPEGNVIAGQTPAVNAGRSLVIFNNDAGAASFARLGVQSNAGSVFLQTQSIAGGRAVSLYSNTGGALNVFTQDAQALNLGTNNNASRMVFGSTGGITVNEDMQFASGTRPVAKNTAAAWVNFDGTV